MNAKEYLNQIRGLDRDIESRIREKEDFQASLVGTPVLTEDKVQASGSLHPDEKMARLVHMSLEIDQKIDQLYNLKREISKSVDQVEDPLLRAILRDRYINCLSFEKMAELYNQTERNLYRLHGQALTAFRSLCQ